MASSSALQSVQSPQQPTELSGLRSAAEELHTLNATLNKISEDITTNQCKLVARVQSLNEETDAIELAQLSAYTGQDKIARAYANKIVDLKEKKKV